MATISAGEGGRCPLRKNTGFRLKEIACCSTNGHHFVNCDGARLFYSSKEIRYPGQSSLRKRDGGGNHSCCARNRVGFRALFMWGHSALTSLIGNQKIPGSILLALPCLQLFGSSSSHKSPAVFSRSSVCFLASPRQSQGCSTQASISSPIFSLKASLGSSVHFLQVFVLLCASFYSNKVF